MASLAIKLTIVMTIVALTSSVALLSAPMMNATAQENMTETDQNMTNNDQTMNVTGAGNVSGIARFG